VRAALTEMGVSVPPPFPPPPAVQSIEGEYGRATGRGNSRGGGSPTPRRAVRACRRVALDKVALRTSRRSRGFTRASPQVLSGAISTLGASFCLFLCMYNVFFLYGSFIFTVHPVPPQEIRRRPWGIEKASPSLTDQTLFLRNGVWSHCGFPGR